MNKDFQFSDPPKKKLVCISRRMRDKSREEDYQYIKDRIKEAPSPKDEISDLLKNAEKLYDWQIGWCNYGLLGIGIVIVGGMILIGYTRGSDFLMDNIGKLLLMGALTVSSIYSFRTLHNRTYECQTDCLRKIRAEIEEEEKKRQEMYN